MIQALYRNRAAANTATCILKLNVEIDQLKHCTKLSFFSSENNDDTDDNHRVLYCLDCIDHQATEPLGLPVWLRSLREETRHNKKHFSSPASWLRVSRRGVMTLEHATKDSKAAVRNG